MRFLFGASALCLFVVTGCSESHSLVGDAGPGNDAVVIAPDGGGCGPMPFTSCVFESNHVCGDVALFPECVDDAWVCPGGSRSDAVCWCYGNAVHGPECECTPTGWECPPSVCPTDPSAEGTACTMEGQSCGSCSDPCGWCNILRCEGGIWRRLEAPPPEPGTCESFACGPDLRCVRGNDYCAHTISDIGGEPDTYVCSAFDPGCPAADCTCFLGVGWSCEDDGEGAVTITNGGG